MESIPQMPETAEKTVEELEAIVAGMEARWFSGPLACPATCEAEAEYRSACYDEALKAWIEARRAAEARESRADERVAA